MNTKHISLAFAAAVALLAGCAKSPIETSSDTNGLTDLELSHVGAIESKAVIDGTTFPEGGEIGLFLFKDEMATQDYGEGYKNVKYAYNSDKKKWTASPSIKVGSTPGYLFGYYPYDSKSKDVKAIPIGSSLNGDDVMYASKQVEPITDKTASSTSIVMNHALARVSITIKNNGYSGAAELTKIKFYGAEIAPTGTLNAIDGKIIAEKDEVSLDVTGDAQTITAAGTTYECLLVPSDEVSGKQAVDLTLTIGDIDKKATLSGENGVIIAKGTKSNITITLSNKGITVQTVSVDDWKEVEVGGHKVTVRLSEEVGFANDALVDIRTDGSSVTIKSHSALTGRRTSCTCTPAGKATCTPSIDATTGICTFTITDVQDDITAEVGYLKYNATVEYDSDMGSVKLNGVAVASGSPVQFFGGEEVKFLAEAKSGCGFVKWTDGSDKDLSTDNPYTVSSVTSDITLKAIFEYEIAAEVTPVGAGTVTGAGIYAKGSTVTLTATAGGSFAEFVGWAKAESPGTIISTDNPYEFTVSQPASYVAVFKLKDALSGVFTVAADEQGNPTKKVQFSKGNLYYNGTTFNFEANQYDTTPSSDVDREPNHISHFMWCDNAANARGLSYDTGWDGTNKSFFAANDFTVNGFSGWSTLTGGNHGEWEYLLNIRKTKYGTGELSESNHRYAAVKVNGMVGLLIFPDDFSSWPSEDAGIEPQTFNTNSNNWNERDYTIDQFNTLQKNGCVFLPAAGFRNGSNGNAYVRNVGDDGYYWSASPSGSDDAINLYFSSGKVGPSQSTPRNRGQSVRLVTESK